MEVKVRVWVGFAGLCLLSGSAWVLGEWGSGVLGGLAAVAVHHGVLAVLFALVGGWPKGFVRLGVLAGLMVGLPVLMVTGASGALSSLTVVLVFGLVPVFVVFVEAKRAEGFGVRESPMGLMGWALAGLGGAGLLVPFELPTSAGGWGWLVGLVVVAGVSGWAAVRVHGELVGGFGGSASAQGSFGMGLPEIWGIASLFCGVVAVMAGVFCWVGWVPVVRSVGALEVEAVRCFLVDGPVMVLTVWLVREMRPSGFAARFVVVPLVTIVEGFVVVRPGMSWTMWVGVGLMAAGGWGLLKGDSAKVQEGLGGL